MVAMRLFKHAVTGAVGEYPDHYGDLFPNMEPVDAPESCLDCIPQVDEQVMMDDEAPAYEEEDYNYE